MSEHPILFSPEMVRAILACRKTQTRRIVKLPETRLPVNAIYPNGDGNWVAANTNQPHGEPAECWEETIIRCRYGKPGDRLWVRETWRETFDPYNTRVIEYNAGGSRLTDGKSVFHGKHACLSILPRWKPSIHMPRWASRIALVVASVRVERLQQISESDALSEGIMKWTKDGQLLKYWPCDPVGGEMKCDWADLPRSARCAYRHLWTHLNAKPTPVKIGGKISYYVSYPWGDGRETRTHRGKPWYVFGNPWVWVVSFKRIERN